MGDVDPTLYVSMDTQALVDLSHRLETRVESLHSDSESRGGRAEAQARYCLRLVREELRRRGHAPMCTLLELNRRKS